VGSSSVPIMMSDFFFQLDGSLITRIRKGSSVLLLSDLQLDESSITESSIRVRFSVET
jgi:hypothetical protein